ncbi:hypothetical protein P152DRAFT_456143 [Eremomyces bilateralis CBS 781.70]|uniref:Uncharacterized protein n=1 Tax=Eremomyces bilateralis CBS 781.70 TaxID=1392243 RepID=A0A6G1GB73_9PEZI|nr:uncharacterized protein P152DRAFT_456143 [Eremomyces bilateralis CBS 781.70]KAF1815099.1 hypothetical protein P152DRAFT_456143 [Eremomyces bilateralis CBS 781.70]
MSNDQRPQPAANSSWPRSSREGDDDTESERTAVSPARTPEIPDVIMRDAPSRQRTANLATFLASGILTDPMETIEGFLAEEEAGPGTLRRQVLVRDSSPGIVFQGASPVPAVPGVDALQLNPITRSEMESLEEGDLLSLDEVLAHFPEEDIQKLGNDSDSDADSECSHNTDPEAHARKRQGRTPRAVIFPGPSVAELSYIYFGNRHRRWSCRRICQHSCPQGQTFDVTAEVRTQCPHPNHRSWSYLDLADPGVLGMLEQLKSQLRLDRHARGEDILEGLFQRRRRTRTCPALEFT